MGIIEDRRKMGYNFGNKLNWKAFFAYPRFPLRCTGSSIIWRIILSIRMKKINSSGTLNHIINESPKGKDITLFVALLNGFILLSDAS